MMNAKYIVVEAGGPSTTDALPGFTSTRLAVIHRFWENCEAFDAEGHYRVVVSAPPIFTPIQTFLARLCFNPMETVDGKWERVGNYDRNALIQMVQHGLGTDDDRIQQWFEGPDVIRLMEASQSFAEMLLAVGAICGQHETDPGVQAYVERILGKQEEEA